MPRPELPITGPPNTTVPPRPLGDAPSHTRGADLREEDLHALLVHFYERVSEDALLSPYFADVDMAAHMPTIVDFWSTMVFQTRRYSGNAFKPHLDMPGLTHAHFVRWLATLDAAVDDRFAGPNAERMKELGHRVAFSMQVRLGIPPVGDVGKDLRIDARSRTAWS